jgi:hypothetical protein
VKKNIFYLIAIMSLVWACITPYEADVKSTTKRLVVSGSLTNTDKEQRIQLTYSADYTNRASNLDCAGAKINLTDDKGKKIDYVETSAGIYRIPANLKFVAEVGRTYQINIRTLEGENYQSKPELMRPVSEITNITTEYNFKPSEAKSQRYGWDVYVNTKDPETTGDYYRWDWTHYRKIDICDKKKLLFFSPLFYGLPCCTNCWDITKCYDCINIGSDALINGKSISNKKIARIPLSGRDRYFLEIEQQSLSKEAYQYFQTIDQLLNNVGGVFDAAPAAIKGNITNLGNPTETVIGYFNVSAVSKKVINQDRSSVTGVVSPPVKDYADYSQGTPPCAECKESDFRTSVKPTNWVL